MTKTESNPAGSPEDLLKAAVAGKAADKPDAEAGPAAASGAGKGLRLPTVPAWLRRDARAFGAAVVALVLGTALGAGVTGLSRPGRSPLDAVASMRAGLDAGRMETARLGSEVAQLHQILADLRATSDSARKEAAARSAALGERVAQADKNLVGKLAALGERFEAVEREQTARIASLAAQPERRTATSAPAPVAKAEPALTGSIGDSRAAEPKVAEAKAADQKVPDAKPKPVLADRSGVIDGWAVRDVFGGSAIVENRRRRIVEVGPGDMLPGVGRVEAVERRGHDWVVITHQGIVTAQPW